ncbi:MAG: tyrosine-type recombinase/integrase [Acidimicrobiales bacterium]
MSVGQFVLVRGPLAGFAVGFADVLKARGYSPRTIEAQLRMVRQLSSWLEDRGIGLVDLAPEIFTAYSLERRKATATLRSPAALVPIVGYLREMRAIPPAPPVQRFGQVERVIASFEQYLASDRGLAAATIGSYCSQVRPLLSSLPDDDWASLTSERVRHVDHRASTQKPRSVQVGINAVRSLLRWMWRERLIASPLHEQVLSMFAPSGPPLPRGLTPAEVSRLVQSLSQDPAARIRDEALVTLMLRLGLRAGETAALELEDLNWREGILTVKGKGGRIDRMPLPNDVGATLVSYLGSRPGPTLRREVFLAIDAPHGAIGSAAVSSVVGRALRAAGIVGGGGAHRLRHSAAMRVINGGGGLVEAGQLLRHSSVSATAIYARTDIAGLAALARPWPGEER